MNITIPEPPFKKKDVLERKANDLYRTYFMSMHLDTKQGIRLINELIYETQEKDRVIVIAYLINRLTVQYNEHKNKIRDTEKFSYEIEYQDIFHLLYSHLEDLGISFDVFDDNEKLQYFGFIEGISEQIDIIQSTNPELSEQANYFKDKLDELKELIGLDKETLFKKTIQVLFEIMLTNGFESIGTYLIKTIPLLIRNGIELIKPFLLR